MSKASISGQCSSLLRIKSRLGSIADLHLDDLTCFIDEWPATCSLSAVYNALCCCESTPGTCGQELVSNGCTLPSTTTTVTSTTTGTATMTSVTTTTITTTTVSTTTVTTTTITTTTITTTATWRQGRDWRLLDSNGIFALNACDLFFWGKTEVFPNNFIIKEMSFCSQFKTLSNGTLMHIWHFLLLSQALGGIWRICLLSEMAERGTFGR